MLIEQVDILNVTIYYVTKLVTYCVIFSSFLPFLNNILKVYRGLQCQHLPVLP